MHETFHWVVEEQNEGAYPTIIYKGSREEDALAAAKDSAKKGHVVRMLVTVVRPVR